MNYQSQDWIKLLQETDLFLYGLIRGTILLTPRSQKIWSLLIAKFDEQFVQLGIENVNFPALIPMTQIEKETKNFTSFSTEMLTITQVGTKKLDKANWLVLRPTSEVIFSHYFHNKIRSYRDLPILINQWTNVWRWEKNTYPFLRTNEFFWQEGHGVFQNRKAITDFFPKINKCYQTILEKTCLIPTIFGEKSKMETFAGAIKTWTHETLLPDGQFLQLATTHDLGKQFSQIFQINFLNEKNQKSLVEQSSWGLSTRVLAAIFLTHADEKGLILPPQIADQQIWILPLKSNDHSQIMQWCQEMVEKLKTHQYRVKLINMQEKSLGSWIYKWEKSGIPIRIEIGKEELKNNMITYSVRATNQKSKMKFDLFLKSLPIIISKIEETMKTKAKSRLNNSYKKITDFLKYAQIPEKNQAYLVNFCGQQKCEKEIQVKTKTTSRVVMEKLEKTEKCFHCQSTPAFKTIFGRSY